MLTRSLSQVILCGLLVAACATVPYTRRNQFVLVSESQSISLGEMAYRQLIEEQPICHDRWANSILRRVGTRIAQVSERPAYHWEFTLFADDEQVNAFALPGGKIGVFTGILPVAKDEAGLAAILGHEVAHVLARHPSERMSRGMVLELLGQAGSAALGNAVDPRTLDLLMRAYGLGATVGVMLPFSRAQEAEADHIGLILSAKAGYDPAVALHLWERMAQIGGKSAPPEFLSTHPHYSRRQRDIEGWLPDAYRYYREWDETIGQLPTLEGLDCSQ